MSFLTWRAINDKLSTDDKVARLGINIPRGCHSCDDVNRINIIETVDHLFCQGDHAKRV